MFQHLVPTSWGAVWESYRPFRGWSLAEGNVSLGAGLRFQRQAVLPALSQLPDCPCNVTIRPPVPANPPPPIMVDYTTWNSKSKQTVFPLNCFGQVLCGGLTSLEHGLHSSFVGMAKRNTHKGRFGKERVLLHEYATLKKKSKTHWGVPCHGAVHSDL